MMSENSDRIVVLVVDDNRPIRSSIRRTLECNDYKTLEAEDGKVALRIAEQQHLDVVITDIFMPEMDGLEVIRALSKSKPSLPIIAMSASVELPYLYSASQFGASYTLEKPFTDDQLLWALRKSIEPRNHF